MAKSLFSYLEASEQVSQYIQALADGGIELQLRSHVQTRMGERVDLGSAPGRVLAQDIRADRDQPPFPRSTRDGFACRAADANTHRPLQLAGHIRAGQAAGEVLRAGEVWEIMTGASVPHGADAVFMVEHAEQASGFVSLAASRSIEAGENIVPRGAEAKLGDLLVPRGKRMSASGVAMAAQCGYAELTMTARPRVAILSTGDELVRIDETPGPGQIRNSNSPMLAAMVTAAGGVPVVLPVVPDEEHAVEEAIRLAMSSRVNADLILFTGGISAGRFDLIEGGLTKAGARFFFAGVAIQPGKPVVFGHLPREDRNPLPFFALPGNPISTAVTYYLFAAPLLGALAGNSNPFPRFGLAQMTGEWRGKAGLTRFLPAWCDFGSPTQISSDPNLVGPTPRVRLLPWRGSGDIAAFSRSNCFLVVSPDLEWISERSLARILLL